MRLYHFLNREHGLDSIRKRRLKIATLDEINDPFELAAIGSKDKSQRAALKRFRDKWAKRFGMLCFSKGWDNPVQWSHYGEKHKGLCLGFDVADNICSDVEYSPERINIDLEDFDFEAGEGAEREAIRWSTTKFDHWSYEQEVRVFLALKERGELGLYWCQLDEQIQLREVIVGPTSDVSRKEVQAAIGHKSPKVDLIKARLAFQKYRVVRQRREDLWS